jgi:hydrogenase nickel incorporation protein HypA/HybF
VHEYSIVEALVARVTVEARLRGATAVHGLEVRLGELSGVEPGLLRTAYETFRAGGICANAALRLTTIAAEWVCSRCARAITHGEILRCPDCGAPARLARGDEILLDRIDLEVP